MIIMSRRSDKGVTFFQKECDMEKRTISFGEFCALDLIGRVVEQKIERIIRRSKVQQKNIAETKAPFAKISKKTVQLRVSDLLYWDNQNKKWTQAPPSKKETLTNTHVPLYEGAPIFVLTDGTITFGSVIIYPPGQVPEAPAVI